MDSLLKIIEQPVSSADGSRAREPLIVFVHIRKTAGKTLRQVLYRQYGRRGTRLAKNYFTEPEVSFESLRDLAASPPDDLRVVHGHMLFWPDLPWPDGTRFFTMLRDPVERTISHYYWLRARSQRFTKSLEEAVTDGSIHDNLQTRVLAGVMPPLGGLTNGALARASQRLDRFAVVGLTDRFDESLVFLTQAFGWHTMAYRRENVTPLRPAQEQVPPGVLELVRAQNAFDLKLYRRAQKRFQAAVERQGDDFRIELEALRQANTRVARAAEARSPRSRRPRSSPVFSGGPLDLRALLVEARTELLVRDAELDRRTSASRPSADEEGDPVDPTPTQGESSDEERAADLQRAAEAAGQRLKRIEKEIATLEAGGERPEAPELAALRTKANAVDRRLRGFERRLAKIQDRLDTRSPAHEHVPPG